MSRLRLLPGGLPDHPPTPQPSIHEENGELLRDHAPCGYLATTPKGGIIAVNDTFLRLTGYRRHELVDQFRFVDLLTPGGKIYHETHFAPALTMQGAMYEIALELVRKDGSRLPVLINAVLERDVAAQSTTIRIAVFDATDRRAYERELLAAKVRAEEAEARATALARTLQRTLVPPAPPKIDHLVVAAGYRPASANAEFEVGGDFYDVFQLSDDEWAIVLGDVCGKGAEAAVVTALVRHTLRALSMQMTSPADAMVALNSVLQRQEEDRFCTVLLLRLRRVQDHWQVTVCAGGHPLPLLRRARGTVCEVGVTGSLVGALESVDFTDVTLDLAQGDTLLLFTDGVTEARGAAGMYGAERLVRMTEVLGADPELLVAGLVDDVVEFTQYDTQDDMALLAVQVPVL